jgi:hypothetical protein
LFFKNFFWEDLEMEKKTAVEKLFLGNDEQQHQAKKAEIDRDLSLIKGGPGKLLHFAGGIATPMFIVASILLLIGTRLGWVADSFWWLAFIFWALLIGDFWKENLGKVFAWQKFEERILKEWTSIGDYQAYLEFLSKLFKAVDGHNLQVEQLQIHREMLAKGLTDKPGIDFERTEKKLAEERFMLQKHLDNLELEKRLFKMKTMVVQGQGKVNLQVNLRMLEGEIDKLQEFSAKSLTDEVNQAEAAREVEADPLEEKFKDLGSTEPPPADEVPDKSSSW